MPEFYERDERGLPLKWLGRIRESMCQLTPEFSVGRTLREYTKHHYLPAASGYAQRAAKESALGAEVLRWQQTIAQRWHTVRFGAVSVETHDNLHVFRVQVLPGDLSLDDFRVELYANPLREGESAVQAMTPTETARRSKRSRNLLGASSGKPCSQRLHTTHRSLPCRRFCALGSRSDPLATMTGDLSADE